MIQRVHVNSNTIKSNAKHDENEPPLTIRTSQHKEYCHEVVLLGQDGLEAARVVYRPNNPLSCGAKVWIETRSGARSVSS